MNQTRVIRMASLAWELIIAGRIDSGTPAQVVKMAYETADLYIAEEERLNATIAERQP